MGSLAGDRRPLVVDNVVLPVHALWRSRAQAGHRSIESTRLYLHLSNDWLAAEYHRGAQLIDASQALAEAAAR